MPELSELATDRVLSPTTTLRRVDTIVCVAMAVATLCLMHGSASAQEAATPAPAEPAPPKGASPEPALVPAPALTSAPGAYPQATSADALRAHRMQAWLEYSSRLSLTARITSGVVNTVSVGFFGLIGVAALAGGDEEDSENARISRNIAGATFLGITAGYVYGAITDFAWKSTDEERLAAWRQLGGNVDARALARFEGELAAEALLAHKAQLYSLGSSIGLAASGGLLLALVPATDLARGDRTFSYVVGGSLFVLGGAGILAALLTEPHQVRAYRLYREGRDPEPDDLAQLRVAPVLGARNVGLTLSGRF